jgi:hypothetical protein
LEIKKMADSNGYGGGHAEYTIDRTYKLVGTYKGQSEDIEEDIADMDTALVLQGEYEIAYGKDWTIVIEEE